MKVDFPGLTKYHLRLLALLRHPWVQRFMPNEQGEWLSASRRLMVSIINYLFKLNLLSMASGS
jgi:hypothetical protein